MRKAEFSMGALPSPVISRAPSKRVAAGWLRAGVAMIHTRQTQATSSGQTLFLTMEPSRTTTAWPRGCDDPATVATPIRNATRELYSLDTIVHVGRDGLRHCCANRGFARHAKPVEDVIADPHGLGHARRPERLHFNAVIGDRPARLVVQFHLAGHDLFGEESGLLPDRLFLRPVA